MLTASFLQAMRSTDYSVPFISQRSAAIGAFQSSIVAAISSSLSDLLLYHSHVVFFDRFVGIQASRISIPVSLLMLLA